MAGVKNVHLSEEERSRMVQDAADAYAKFMDVVLPDWDKDVNSVDTPRRVAKSFVNDMLSGVYGKKPQMTSFDNVDRYDGIVFQGGIKVRSMCAHHHLPFFGTAYVAYIPKSDGKIIGLSKLNRIVDFCSRRPQVQENLTVQVSKMVSDLVGANDGVAVYIKSVHTCVCHRGVGHDSQMQTAKLTGLFFTNEIGTRQEFYQMVRNGLDTQI